MSGTDHGPPAAGTRRAGASAIRPAVRRSWAERLVLAVGVATTALLVLGAVGIAYGVVQFSFIERYDVELADAAAAGAPENWLVVGSDTRANVDATDAGSDAFLDGDVDQTSQRADTILIVRVDPGRRTMDLISLPRDLWVMRSDGHPNRINTAYSLDDGRQALIDTIGGELGIDVNHYVEIDFRAFKDLVGAVGGVPLWFDSPMRDESSGLSIPAEGCYVLQGSDALAFARARHLEVSDGVDWVPDPTGDLGRITRQQVFLKHAFTRARDKAVALDGPLAVKDLIDVATTNVGIDDSLTIDDLLGLAQRFAEAGDDALITHTLPVEEFTTPGGAAVVRVLPGEAEPILALFGGEVVDDGSAPDDVDLVVLNGTGRPGEAGHVAAAYGELGFQAGFIGDVNDDEGVLARTEVRYGEGAGAGAALVASHLTSGAVLVADDDLPDGRVTVATGQDLTTVQRTPVPIAEVAGDDGDAGDDGSSATTTTVHPSTTWGVTPGEAPPGSSCG